MSNRSLTAKDNEPTPMWRRNPATGELFSVVPQQSEYCTPGKGMRGRFQLTGISDVFTLTSAQYGESEKVRLEFLILKVSDKEQKFLEGKRFTELYGWSIGPKSYLGQLLGELRGQPVQRGETIDPDSFIDTEFVTSTTLSFSADGQKSYPGVSRDAIDPSKTVLSRYVGAAGAQQPELVGVTVGGSDDEENPFLGSGEDEDL